MKTPLFFIVYLICVVTLISCAPVSQNYYEKKDKQPLNVQQLNTELTDTTLHLESIDFDAFVSFKSNRVLDATSISGGTDTGRWFLEGEDIICMEFSSWYFGDKRCYRLIKAENEYIFFTLNGARSYTAATSKKPAEGSINKESSQKAELVVTEITKPKNNPIETPTERKQRFIRLAKNCPGCNLSGADLSGAELNRANLSGANLSGANLTNAQLRHANLKGADLSGATLVRANLPGADLSLSDLSNADLSGCNLIRANVTGATTTNIKLTGAHLESLQGSIQ